MFKPKMSSGASVGPSKDLGSVSMEKVKKSPFASLLRKGKDKKKKRLGQ